MVECERAEFDVAAEQAGPAQTSGQVFGAQKIFVAEGGIFADRNVRGVNPRTGQKFEIEMLRLHRTPKRQSSRCATDVVVDTLGAHRNRQRPLVRRPTRMISDRASFEDLRRRTMLIESRRVVHKWVVAGLVFGAPQRPRGAADVEGRHRG